jgi:hypothetical protein
MAASRAALRARTRAWRGAGLQPCLYGFRLHAAVLRPRLPGLSPLRAGSSSLCRSSRNSLSCPLHVSPTGKRQTNAQPCTEDKACCSRAAHTSAGRRPGGSGRWTPAAFPEPSPGSLSRSPCAGQPEPIEHQNNRFRKFLGGLLLVTTVTEVSPSRFVVCRRSGDRRAAI